MDDLDESGLVGTDEAVAHGEVDDDERGVGLPQRQLLTDTLQDLWYGQLKQLVLSAWTASCAALP